MVEVGVSLVLLVVVVVDCKEVEDEVKVKLVSGESFCTSCPAEELVKIDVPLSEILEVKGSRVELGGSVL